MIGAGARAPHLPATTAVEYPTTRRKRGELDMARKISQ